MIWLILAMLSSALVSVSMRWSGRHVRNNISMLAVNYVMCTLLSWGFSGFAPPLPAGKAAVGIGLVSGVFYLVSFVLLQWNIGKNGVVLPALFMKLGVLVPVVLSMVLFREMPAALQACGILLALCGIVLLNSGKGQKAGSGLGLIALLLCGGLCDATAKVFEELGSPQENGLYLLWTFAAALALCAALALLRHQRLSPPDLFFGALIGIPNYLSSWFLLRALGSIPAVIVYPSYCIGAMLLITAAGCFLFREKLTRRQLTAGGVILLALLLLNL